MDAMLKRFGVLCTLCLSATFAQAATFKTANFVATASTAEVARRAANCAEFWRRELAIQWLGKPLPNWYRPCPITVRDDLKGAGGQTTFTFENGEVYGWKMQVQGSLERILDSVIPHEVNHTIFASYFRRPLPRWADEGAATLFEHESERARQTHLLNRVMQTSRRIPLAQLLTIREYPPDMQDVLTLYAEGYSLAGFLVGSKGEEGRRVYLKFLEDADKIGWAQAIRRHYGYDSIDHLEQHWTKWVMAGSPALVPEGTSVAQADENRSEPASNTSPVTVASADETVIRSQSPSGHEAATVSESQTQENTPELAAVKAEPAPLPGIPRRLRVARTSEESSSASRDTASTQGLNFSPRVLRHRGTGEKAATLSPTTNGITTNPSAPNYAFPPARR